MPQGVGAVGRRGDRRGGGSSGEPARGRTGTLARARARAIEDRKAGAMAQSTVQMERQATKDGPRSERSRVEARGVTTPRTETLRPARGDKKKVAAAKKPATRAPKGLAFERRYTTRGVDPLDEVTWERRSSIITNPDGSVVFKMEGAEIPSTWSQLATDIVVSKYFRKAGLHGKKELGETSVRQVVHRLSRTIREAGERFGGYFAGTRARPTRSRPSSPTCSCTSTARSTRRSGSTAASSTATASRARVATGRGREHAHAEERAARRGDAHRDEERLRAPAVLGLLHPERRATT
jgi:hypothetical protein